MPTPLLIVGSGGFARETLELVSVINDRAPTWRVVGVLDDDETLTGTCVHGVEVIGTSECVHDHPGALVVPCVASPRRPDGRLALTQRLALPPERTRRSCTPPRWWPVRPPSATAP